MQDAVHNLLDVVIGWDFMRARDQHVDFGQIPALDSAPRELLNLVRTGFVTGLLNDDTDAVTPLIQSFWAQGDVYRPTHLGRCYPHGHADAPDLPTCQEQEINGLLTLLLLGRQA